MSEMYWRRLQLDQVYLSFMRRRSKNIVWLATVTTISEDWFYRYEGD